MKLSVIIELEYTPDDCTGPFANSYIEKAFDRSLKSFLQNEGLDVTHLESAAGSLKEAFGIEEYESQKAGLEQQLTASLGGKR